MLRRRPASVLEIGYGMGTFLEAAKLGGVRECCGNDVARYPLPEGCTFLEWEDALARSWEVTALFDVLEHIPDLGFLGRLRSRVLAVAVPYCRWRELDARGEAADEWFRDWRMRLPDEHVHHFDPESLTAFLARRGFRCVELNTHEDGLRLREGERGPNILGGLFESA